MTQAGAQFGLELAKSFRQASSKVPRSEIRLFQALMAAFSTLPSRFRVEEYHGAKHQVRFKGEGTWRRSPARCELCDLVLVTYRLRPTFEARVTFLQAKYSRGYHPMLCTSAGVLNNPTRFAANLEQWDLLARRPVIQPVPPFKAHPLLLQSALLPSVGSFGVFHHRRDAHVDLFYASADTLKVVGATTSRHGLLETKGTIPITRMIAGHLETTFSCCIPKFGAALYSLEIGTPVHAAGALDASPLAGWLRDMLRRHVVLAVEERELARDFLRALGEEDRVRLEDDSVPPPMLLIRSEDDPSLE